MINERTERQVQRWGTVGALACFALAAWLYLSPNGNTAPEPDSDAPSAGEQTASGPVLPDAPAANPADADALLQVRKRTGDLDMMLEKRVIRALVVHNPMQYFLDGGTQRGTAYEGLKALEKMVNERYDSGQLEVHVAFLPVSRDQLLPYLVEGYGDIAAANLTVTPSRQELVDFSDPFIRDVQEVVVTSHEVEPLEDVTDLAGQEVHARPSSSYYASLQHQSEKLREQGMEPIRIVDADELLEDGDLLEMVNAGLIPMVVVDRHKALFWAGVFDNLRVHDVAVSTGGEIAWAFRKNSPKLQKLVNEFVAGHRKGTLLGNIVLKRYLKENKWVRNARSEEDRARFMETIDLFRKYGEQYDFDWLMLAALGYQESRLDQSVRSAVGAVGVMQVLPSTASDPNVDISGIEETENNIHAGTKYLRFLRSRYFSDDAIPPRDRTLFAFASYNAGPARVAQLRKEAAARGLDPNTWFDNVEVVAAERIGRETVQYVSNIYKYYVAYRLLLEQHERKQEVVAEYSAG